MDYKSATTQRFAELRPGGNGKFQTEWHLTDTKLVDAVRLSVPPLNAIPIIFVPGIMGSNLCDLKNNPVWLLNSYADVPAGLAWGWSRKKADARQTILHPQRTKVYIAGAVPKNPSSLIRTSDKYIKHGWGEVSEASYHKFLLWLDKKMNGERNPAAWEDFTNSTTGAVAGLGAELSRTLSPGLQMKMNDLPLVAEPGYAVAPVTSDELLKRAQCFFPIYAFGYNWLASNRDAADSLKIRIRKVISGNNVGPVKCSQVILVTHSMGGLVARACAQLPDMENSILGIVHGVMPATGAAVAYRRCKVGMKDEDFAAGLVIGSDGPAVTAVFAQAPGALQLLPSENYGTNWLEISDKFRKNIAALPLKDPYEEIYLQRDKWWGLVKEQWLRPESGKAISWDEYVVNVKQAKEFHRKIAGKYHKNTYAFYGGGSEKKSFSKIQWNIREGMRPEVVKKTSNLNDVLNMVHKDIRTDGSNNLYVGGNTEVKTSNRGDNSMPVTMETSIWEIHCSQQDSAGDGTVPISSGKEPRKSGGKNILQQFELSGVKHEPAYRDYPIAQTVTYYAITKLASMAKIL